MADNEFTKQIREEIFKEKRRGAGTDRRSITSKGATVRSTERRNMALGAGGRRSEVSLGRRVIDETGVIEIDRRSKPRIGVPERRTINRRDTVRNPNPRDFERELRVQGGAGSGIAGRSAPIVSAPVIRRKATQAAAKSSTIGTLGKIAFKKVLAPAAVAAGAYELYNRAKGK